LFSFYFINKGSFNGHDMKNTIVLTIVTLAIAALVTGMTTMTTQVANAQGNSDEAYGKEIIKPNAQTGTWGSSVSSAAKDGSGQGIGDFRANGCKQQEPGVGGGCATVPP
jgi:hypothetical protein